MVKVAARAALTLVAAVALSGCYKYVPIAETPEPGSDVRVRLNSEAALERERTTGILIRSMDGRFMGTDQGTFQLELPSRKSSEFQSALQFNNSVQLKTADVESFEVREMDKGRTYGLVGGAVIVTGFLIQRAFSGGGDGSGDGPPGGDPPLPDGITLFRIGVGH